MPRGRTPAFLLAAIALVALVALLFLALRDDDRRRATTGSPAAAASAGPRVAAAPAPSAGASATTTTAPLPAEPAPRAMPGPEEKPSSAPAPSTGDLVLASIRGRVVDGRRVPVRGARVVVSTAALPPRGERARDVDREAAAAAVSRVPFERRLALHDALRSGETLVELGSVESGPDGTFSFVPAAAPLVRERSRLSVSAALEREGTALAGVACYVKLHDVQGGVLELGDISVRRYTALRVVAKSRGAAVEGARVRFSESYMTPGRPWDGSRVNTSVKRYFVDVATDLSGTARNPTESRKAHFTVSKRGFASEQRHVQLSTEAELAAEAVVEVELSPDASVAGTVRDASGPRQGVLVTADLPEATEDDTRDHGHLTEATTDADGRFDLPGLAAGRRTRVVAYSPDPALLDPAVELAPPAAVHLELVRAGAILVALALPTDEDVKYAELNARQVAGWTWLERRDETTGAWSPTPATVKPEGAAIRISRVRPGIVRVCARGTGTLATVVGEPATVVSGDEPAKVELRLRTRDRKVAGRAVDREGKPLAGVKVEYDIGARRHEEIYMTGRDGKFVLDHLPPGEVTIHVGRRDLETTKVPVAIDTRDVGDVVLTPKR